MSLTASKNSRLQTVFVLIFLFINTGPASVLGDGRKNFYVTPTIEHFPVGFDSLTQVLNQIPEGPTDIEYTIEVKYDVAGYHELTNLVKKKSWPKITIKAIDAPSIEDMIPLYSLQIASEEAGGPVTLEGFQLADFWISIRGGLFIFRNCIWHIAAGSSHKQVVQVNGEGRMEMDDSSVHETRFTKQITGPDVFIDLTGRAHLKIRNCKFRENMFFGSKGFIEMRGAPTLEIEDTDFIANYVSTNDKFHKGLVAQSTGGEITVKNSNFQGSCFQNGCIFHSVSTKVTIEDSIFYNIQSDQDRGSAVAYFQDCVLEMSRARFLNNRGAQVLALSGTNIVKMEHSEFDANGPRPQSRYVSSYNAIRIGLTIHSNEPLMKEIANEFKLLMSNTTFSKNEGSLYVFGQMSDDAARQSSINILNTTFDGNIKDEAPVMHSKSNIKTQMVKSVVRNNRCPTCKDLFTSTSEEDRFMTSGSLKLEGDKVDFVARDTQFLNNELGQGSVLRIKLDKRTDSRIRFDNCKFFNNSAFEGGLFYLEENANVTVSGGEFRHNRGNSGGVVYADRHSVFHSINSDYSKNTANGNAAIGYFVATSHLELEGGTLSENRGSVYAAGFEITGNATANISNAVFQKNFSPTGTAILVSVYGSARVEGCRFEANEASDCGGVLVVSSMKKSIFRNSVFLKNTAKNGGSVGLLEQPGDEINFSPETSDWSLDFEKCTFVSNTAWNYAVFLSMAYSLVNFKNCDFENNFANDGAVYRAVHNSSIYVTGSTFKSNAGKRGGVMILSSGQPKVTVHNSTFDGNVASSGGVAYLKGDPNYGPVKLNLIDCNLDNNHAIGPIGGGAITAFDAELRVTNSKLAFNNAKENDGGAVYFHHSGKTPGVMFKVIDSQFRQNQAKHSGGAACIQRETKDFEPIFKFSSFKTNSALIGGSIYFATSQGKSERMQGLTNVVFSNNVASNYGHNIATGPHELTMLHDNDKPLGDSPSIMNGRGFENFVVQMKDAYGNLAKFSESNNVMVKLEAVSTTGRTPSEDELKLVVDGTFAKPSDNAEVAWGHLDLYSGHMNQTNGTDSSGTSKQRRADGNSENSVFATDPTASSTSTTASSDTTTSDASSSSALGTGQKVAQTYYLRASIDSIELSQQTSIVVTDCASQYKAVTTYVDGKKFMACEPDPATYELPPGLVMVVLALSLLGIVAATLSALMIVSNINHEQIKAGSPKFMLIIIQGIMIGYMCMVFQTAENTTHMCIIRAWAGHISFAVVCGALFTKCWRIQLIFHNKDSKDIASVVRDAILFRIFFSIVGVIILYLTAWTILSAPESYYVPDTTDRLLQYKLCYHKSDIWLYVLYGIESCMLLWGSYLAYKTRDVEGNFNESKVIGFSIWNILFVGSAALGYSNFATTNVFVSALLSSLAIFVVLSSMIALLFGPKIKKIYFSSDEDEIDVNALKGVSSGGGSYDSSYGADYTDYSAYTPYTPGDTTSTGVYPSTMTLSGPTKSEANKLKDECKTLRTEIEKIRLASSRKGNPHLIHKEGEKPAIVRRKSFNAGQRASIAHAGRRSSVLSRDSISSTHSLYVGGASGGSQKPPGGEGDNDSESRKPTPDDFFIYTG
eukprot:Nk52_evm7s278 gene=Nk52_evmTU7s278